MNNTLSKKILSQIESGDLTPLPRWRFIVLHTSFWIFAIASVVIGAIAVAATLFIFIDFYRHGLPLPPPPPPPPMRSTIIDFLQIIPLVWVVVFAVFILIAQVSLKHTRSGYRYQLSSVVLVSVVASILLGSAFHLLGVGRATHGLLEQAPPYRSMVYDAHAAWDRPTIGRLAGMVVAIESSGDFSLVDFRGRLWRVRVATSTKTLLPEASSTIRMFGTLDPRSCTFIAQSIHEWER